MRPVTKLKPGDEVILLIGNKDKVKQTYNPYQSAKDPLTFNIGNYCSYCERYRSDDALAIEHIKPKGLPKYKHLEFEWSNFLLACSTCNGKANKSNKDVILNKIHLPHLNNTMMSIHYGRGGFVQVHPNLIQGSSEYLKAKALIDLVGLDKCPAKYGDNRWQRRDETWQLAVRYEQKLVDKEIAIEPIIDLALSKGFFSVWFTVFKNHNEVKEALISNFPGTTLACFEPTNNFDLILRNPPNI